MKRGFTMLELMIASSISVIILTAVLGLLFGVWTMAKEASDEVQGALHARAFRERMFYGLKTVVDSTYGSTNHYGLVCATNINVSAAELLVYMQTYEQDGNVGCFNSEDDRVVKEAIDLDRSASANTKTDFPLKFIYLKMDLNRTLRYCDRLMIPVCGKHATTDQIRGSL